MLRVPERRWRRGVPDASGAVLGRIEDEDRLWVGMKDRFAYVVPEAGASELWFRGRSYEQRPGLVVLKQPGEIYRELRRAGRATFDVVLVPVEEVEAARAALGAAEVVFASPELRADDARARPLLALHAALRAGGSGAGFDRQVAVAEAAAALARLGAGGGAEASGRGERPAIRKARAYLREHLAGPVRLDELAAFVRLDKYHLVRAFRAHVGVPPYEFLTHLRILRARELLAAGVPAASVAPAVGYYDQSQLHRHFTRLVGMTPGQFAGARRGRATPPSTSPSRR